jgi:hypothetical protein
MLVLDVIELLPPLGLNKCDTWRILSVKCYIKNSMCLQSCIRNANSLVNKEHIRVYPSSGPSIEVKDLHLAG